MPVPLAPWSGADYSGFPGSTLHRRLRRQVGRSHSWFTSWRAPISPRPQANSWFHETLNDEKPKRRLFELLQCQGMQPNRQVNFLSDGGEDVRNVQLYLNPQAEHLLEC